LSKTFLGVLSVLAMLSANSGSLSAAQSAPPAEELILHPGDTITWTPEDPHRLRFGGTVTHNGTQLNLTPFSDVMKVLENFNPAPPSVDGVVRWEAGQQVTAKVKADTATPGVTEFFFTCGVPSHSPKMVTVSFKIAPAVSGQPPRNVQIISAGDDLASFRWVLQTKPGDPTGDRDLRRP
jgi:hypothetical protein